MKINQQIFIKRWKPVLEEYEKIQNKVLPRPFLFVKDLRLAVSYLRNKWGQASQLHKIIK